MRIPNIIIVFVLGAASLAFGQESQLHADFRGEATRFKQSCGTPALKSIPGCAELLFTDHPLHIAVGSIAPQNGFGAGAALVGHWTPNELWRTSWDTDAVASGNGSWRAGFYYKAIHTPIRKITTVSGTTPPPLSGSKVQPSTVINLYTQAISLDQLFFYGLGPASLKTDGTVFSSRQVIVGSDAIVPVTSRVPVSVLGEVNGRFVDLSGNHHESTPSIERLFTEMTAPGLTSQSPVVQLGEGVRLEPKILNDHLQFDYLVQFQQFIAASNSHYSFRRLNLDLTHTIPIYRTSGSYGSTSTNGPDECASALGATKCPAITRNREGSLEFRFLLTESIASSGSVVPFYFQPTLGGSDINGNPGLSSYHDYRFRAPNLILFRQGFEHSIWGPIGFVFSADEGKVALNRGDIGFDQLAHSFSTGLTLRAGGLPAISFAFAWGGPEGTHTLANVNTSLLGGSVRPPEF